MQDLENKPKPRRKKVKITQFPAIPDKLYFSIGEASKLCAVKPYVIRFWEQAFSVLKPAKLRCGRRYYCQKEILLIRTIRTLLYEKGFTIEGACLQLSKDKDNGSLIVKDSNVVSLVNESIEEKDLSSTTTNIAQNNNVECSNDKAMAKNELLKEIAGRISDIISLLETKPEIA
jgi:DNA-binding transcriptional MerR regulator